MPVALRLSGLRFTCCRRPDKAPARRFVCRTVLHNNRNPLCLMRCAALRLSGLRFARYRRPDKAPARRFVCRTVLHNNRNPLCLLRCAYQAYDLHATVGRIRRQRADLYAKRFYTITAITMPDALRLSGLRFARCRRPDKAPAPHPAKTSEFPRNAADNTALGAEVAV